VRLGRKPARHTLRTMRSAIVMARHLAALGPAPDASNDYVSAVRAPWGMMLNDSLGDCVCADTGHTLMLRTANAGPSLVVPSDDDVLALYEAVGGYDPGDPSTDQGCDETSMCDYLEATGFLGHKSDATGSVDPANLDHVRWCIQLFGACRLGINFPAYAMDAFNAGKPWDAPGSGDDTTIEGGHDVPLVDYRAGTFTCITWGRPQIVTPAFLALYCEEAHSELFFDWVRAQGTAPSGLSLDQLAADLAQIGAPA
jgi:hypothetical protein